MDIQTIYQLARKEGVFTMPKNRKNSGNKVAGLTGRRDSQARRSARSRRGRQHHISVRGELRDAPDVKKIARAVIAMAMAQAEAEAQAQAEHDTRSDRTAADVEPGTPENEVANE